MFTIAAICVSGWVNCLLYWMKAWTSPIDILPPVTCRPPTTAIATKLRLPRNIIAGWMVPARNCAQKLAR